MNNAVWGSLDRILGESNDVIRHLWIHRDCPGIECPFLTKGQREILCFATAGDTKCPNPNCDGGRIKGTQGGCCICERPQVRPPGVPRAATEEKTC